MGSVAAGRQTLRHEPSCSCPPRMHPTGTQPILTCCSASFRCSGSRTVHASQQRPSSSPRSVKKSLSRAEWDPAAAPLGCPETLGGGARRATGPGSSVLLCHFIEEGWYGGESTSAAAGGTHSLLAALLDLGASWCRIWRGMAGILHYRVGKAEVVGDGRGRDLWSDPALSPLSVC